VETVPERVNERESGRQSSLSNNRATKIQRVDDPMKTTNAIELEKVVEESFALLGRVLEESNSFGLESNYREAFIYRHAHSIYHLGQDVVFLLRSDRLDSCQLVVRAMLESLFKLMASVNKSETAVEILVSELEADIERMKLLDPIACAPGIRCSTELAAKLRKEFNITSKKKWTTFECAQAAGLVEEYRGDYFVFSGRGHASTGGIMMQESKIGAGHALQRLLNIIIHSAGGFVQVVETTTPQIHIDEAAHLMNRLVELIRSEVFSEMDDVEHEP
jgi:hypothetical protein